jgi:hypothetical protein
MTHVEIEEDSLYARETALGISYILRSNRRAGDETKVAVDVFPSVKLRRIAEEVATRILEKDSTHRILVYCARVGGTNDPNGCHVIAALLEHLIPGRVIRAFDADSQKRTTAIDLFNSSNQATVCVLSVTTGINTKNVTQIHAITMPWNLEVLQQLAGRMGRTNGNWVDSNRKLGRHPFTPLFVWGTKGEDVFGERAGAGDERRQEAAFTKALPLAVLSAVEWVYLGPSAGYDETKGEETWVDAREKVRRKFVGVEEWSSTFRVGQPIRIRYKPLINYATWRSFAGRPVAPDIQRGIRKKVIEWKLEAEIPVEDADKRIVQLPG